MSSSDSSDDVLSGSAGDDECVAYVRDDIACEYSRVFPDEQMSV